jgi:ABC-2 type transport system permease protein
VGVGAVRIQPAVLEALDTQAFHTRGIGVRKLLIIFWQYLGQYAKTRMAYKSDFFIASFANILATVAGYGFVLVLFGRIPQLKGWKFEEVLFVYGFSLIPMGVFNIVSLNLYDFGEIYIVEGKFDRVLLRPIHSLFQILFENFRLESMQEIFTGLAAVLYCAGRLNIPPTLGNLILFPVLVFCGAVIYTCIFVMISSVNFWLEDRIGLAPPVFNMIAFGRYPMTIYNAAIQFLLSWIIPFAFASFYPTVRYLGRTEFRREFYLVPVVAAVLTALALFIWERGVLEYKSTGS